MKKNYSQTKIEQLINASKQAVDSYIDEVKRPPSEDLSGSARKAELQSIKEAFMNCKEMLLEIGRLEDMLEKGDDLAEKKDFGGSFAEANAK